MTRSTSQSAIAEPLKTTHQPAWLGYLLAVAGVAGAAWLRWELGYTLGLGLPPYITFYPAIILSALFGGTGAGLLSTALSAAAVDYFYLGQPGSFGIETPDDLVGMTFFIGVNLMLSIVCGALRQARRRTELQAQELARAVAMLDLANVMVRDPEDRIIRWNTGCQRLYGFTSGETLGKVSHELLRTQFPEPLENIRTKLLATGRWEGELRHTTRDGRVLVVTSEWLRREAAGQPTVIIEVNTDLTERKGAENALRQSEERFRTLTEVSSQVVWTSTVQGEPAGDSPSWREFTGRRLEQWMGWNWLEAIHPDDRQRVAVSWRNALERAQPYLDEYRLLHLSGVYRYVQARAVPVRNPDGTVREWIGTLTDVSTVKRAEAARNSLAAIIADSDDAVIAKNLEGLITSWNPGAERLFGYSAQQVLGKNIRLIIPPERQEEEDRILATIRHGEKVDHYESQRRTRDGRLIDVSISASPIHDSMGQVVGASKIARDITERKQAEESLRQSEQRLRGIFDNAGVGIVEADTNDRFVAVNDRLCQILGYRREQLLRKTAHDLTAPEDRPRSDLLNTQLHAGEAERIDYEKRYLKSDGSPVWVHVVISAVRDAQGRWLRSIGTVDDITERKQAELELAAARDRLAAELDAMNRLHNLSTRFLQQQDLPALLDGVLETAIVTVGAQLAHVHLLDPATGELPIAAQRGLDESFLDYFGHIKPGPIACGTAIQTSQCVVVEDVTQSPLFLADPAAMQLKLASRIRAMVCTPIMAHTRQAIGVLSIDFHEPHRPSERDLRFLDLLARLAADLIEHKHAQVTIQRRSRFSEALNRLFRETLACETEAQLGAIGLTIAEDLTQSQSGFMAEINPQGRLTDIAISDPGYRACRDRIKEGHTGYRIVPNGLEIHGIYGRVLLDGKGFFTNDPPSHPDRVGLPEGHSPLTAFLGVPLVQGDKPIGMIALANRPGGYTQEQLELLEELAGPIVQVWMRLKAQQALRHSEAQARARAEELSAFLDAVPTFTFLSHDPECRHISSNRVARELLRLPEGANVSQSAPEGHRPTTYRVVRGGRDLAPEELPMQIAAGTGREVRDAELTFVFNDGTTRDLIGNAVPLFDESGKVRGTIGAFMDITQRKRTQETLQRQNRRLQILHQAAADLLLGRDPAELLRGLSAQIAASMGTEVFTLYEADNRDDRLHLRACHGVSKTEEERLEAMRFGRAICAKPFEALQPIIATHLQTTEAPNRRFVRKLGFHSYLYYPLSLGDHLQGTLAFASRSREDFDAADLEFFQTIARTVAEALERKRLESEVQRHATHLEKLVQERTAKLREAIAELEHMSYSMVHDMRAPLRAMQSFAMMLEEECAGCQRTMNLDYFRRIRESADRLDRLITDALNYSEVVRHELPIKPVELGKLLRGMLDTYPNLQSAAADIIIEFEELTVLGNESLLTQCFGNLLGNAVKFVAPGVRPHVRVLAEDREDTQTRRRGDAEPSLPAPPHLRVSASSVRVWVEDNGIGIPKDAQEKIFGMFQRMHRESEYSGTGIGLTIVRKAVERMGGHVGLESEPGRGSKFWIELRMADQAQNSNSIEDAA